MLITVEELDPCHGLRECYRDVGENPEELPAFVSSVQKIILLMSVHPITFFVGQRLVLF